MVRSPLREMTEPTVFFPEVATGKQHDIFIRMIALGVLMSARTSF